MSFRSKQLRKAAGRYLAGVAPANAPAKLPDLLDRTAAELQQRFPWCDRPTADEAALSAWSEIEGRRSRCFVDLEASTPHLIFVVDPVAKTRRPVPTVDIIRLLGPRIAAA